MTLNEFINECNGWPEFLDAFAREAVKVTDNFPLSSKAAEFLKIRQEFEEELSRHVEVG